MMLAWEIVFFWGVVFAVEKVQHSPQLLTRLEHVFRRVFRMPLPANGAGAGAGPAAAAERAASPLDREPEDDDVIAERERVQSGQANAEMIVIQGLRKVFTSGSGKSKQTKIAVRSIWAGIPSGQVFGLLGTNGAGKTTLLRM